MPRLTSVLGVVAAVPVLVAAPVASTSARPHPHAVSPHVARLAVPPSPADAGVVADTGPRSTSRFDLVGARWTGSTRPPGATVEVRTRSAGGWSGWTALTLPDGGPDAGSVDARAAAGNATHATDPLWVGDADGVQARVVDGSGTASAAPAGLQLVTVDGGRSAADATAGAPAAAGSAADAAASQPTIYTRAQWGADESLRRRNGSDCAQPAYASGIRMGFIHHTDTANGYSSSDVPSILRSIYAYHVESNGWCDIGYNFLVDRFGRIWEGRYGGVDRAVIGAHTGGFNTNSFGAALIGSFESTAPSSAMLAGVERLFAWKLAAAYLDPHGTATMTAAAFSGSRYSAGSTVTFNVISGHRNADYTTCPGDAAYADLGAIRSAVTHLIGAGLVAPHLARVSVPMSSGRPVTVRAGVLTSQGWTLTVANASGTTVRTITGTATPSAPVDASWDGTDDAGAPVPPGTYTVTLGSTTAAATALPFSATVTVTPPVTLTAPSTSAYGASVTVSGTANPRAQVVVAAGAPGGAATPAQQTVSAGSTGRWSATVAATSDLSVTASSSGYTTPARTIRVAPLLTAPVAAANRLFLPAGGTLSLAGTALPGTTVTAVTTPSAGTATATAGSDGTWSATLAPTRATSLVLRDARGVASAALAVYPVTAPTTTGADTGWSGRTFTLSGNAGGAPVRVTLSASAPGAAGYSTVAAHNAGPIGGYHFRVTLPSVTAPAAWRWRVTTSAAGTTFGSADGATTVQPAFAPTVTGPRRGYFGSTVHLTGTGVPGDTIRVQARPVTGGSWHTVATTTAAGDTTWRAGVHLTGNLQWRARSASGVSAVRSTVVRPSLHAPASAASGSTVTVWGTALPGSTVQVLHRGTSSQAWRLARTVRASSAGRWTARLRVVTNPQVQSRSGGQRSRTLVVATTR